MPNKTDVTVVFYGKDKSGKTSLMAEFAKWCEANGVEAIVQHADPQIGEKLEGDNLERCRQTRVRIMEMQT